MLLLFYRVLVILFLFFFFFFFKQKTAYEMRISDWSSDVCSSDLLGSGQWQAPRGGGGCKRQGWSGQDSCVGQRRGVARAGRQKGDAVRRRPWPCQCRCRAGAARAGDGGGCAVGQGPASRHRQDRKIVVQGKSVAVRLALGGRRILK